MACNTDPIHQMKLEAGKSYRTRNGLRATCVADNLSSLKPILIIVNDGEYDYAEQSSEDGSVLSTKDEHGWDIISEWSDKPEVNWSIIPPWFKWVAMDKDGEFRAYSAKPGVHDDVGRWIAAKADYMRIYPDFAPKWTGGWKQSLVERPKV